MGDSTAIGAILGTSTTSLGALLIAVGALLVIADVLGPSGNQSGLSFGNTAPQPGARLAASLALVGALPVLAGSLLLLAVTGVSALAVLAVIGGALILVYLAMAFYLGRHFEISDDYVPPWWWRLRHPLWRPPSSR